MEYFDAEISTHIYIFYHITLIQEGMYFSVLVGCCWCGLFYVYPDTVSDYIAVAETTNTN